MEIKYIKWGIASRVGKMIYMNRHLKTHKKLRNALLVHEKAHSDTLTMRDFLLDVDLKELKGMKKEYYKFIMKHPSALVEFLPIKKYEGTVLFNFHLFIIWVAAGGLAWALTLNFL